MTLAFTTKASDLVEIQSAHGVIDILTSQNSWALPIPAPDNM